MVITCGGRKVCCGFLSSPYTQIKTMQQSINPFVRSGVVYASQVPQAYNQTLYGMSRVGENNTIPFARGPSQVGSKRSVPVNVNANPSYLVAFTPGEHGKTNMNVIGKVSDVRVVGALPQKTLVGAARPVKYGQAEFTSFLKGGKDRLVVAYWNDCPHCTPIKELVKSGVNLQAAGVLAVEAEDLASTEDYGFPQVFYLDRSGRIAPAPPGDLSSVLARFPSRR